MTTATLVQPRRLRIRDPKVSLTTRSIETSESAEKSLKVLKASKNSKDFKVYTSAGTAVRFRTAMRTGTAMIFGNSATGMSTRVTMSSMSATSAVAMVSPMTTSDSPVASYRPTLPLPANVRLTTRTTALLSPLARTNRTVVIVRRAFEQVPAVRAGCRAVVAVCLGVAA